MLHIFKKRKEKNMVKCQGYCSMVIGRGEITGRRVCDVGNGRAVLVTLMMMAANKGALWGMNKEDSVVAS